MKKKHPLYSALTEKKEVEKECLLPVPEERITKRPPYSSNFEKVGCLILAGGEGSRLGFSGPKGCVLLPLRKKATLFELLLKKIEAKEKKGPVAIMTSESNHEATLLFLEKNDYFGLQSHEIELFSQNSCPLSDPSGYLLYDSDNNERKAPNGNGEALALLCRLGIWKKWQEAGVESVQVLPIDNPLADPFDPELLGVHERLKTELVLKCVSRIDVEEKLGIVACRKKRLALCEYSEASFEMKREKEGKGLKFFLGNTGLFSLSMDCINRIKAASLPWHIARKVDPGLDENKKIFKYEKFLFDIFPYVDTFQIILSPRSECFAPLKNLNGTDGLKSVALAIEKALIGSKKP